jgi:hypothetical protein
MRCSPWSATPPRYATYRERVPHVVHALGRPIRPHRERHVVVVTTTLPAIPMGIADMLGVDMASSVPKFTTTTTRFAWPCGSCAA